MLKVVVKRWKWARASSHQLVNKKGRMCVMGFIGEAAGVPKKHMLGRGSLEYAINAAENAELLMSVAGKLPRLFKLFTPKTCGPSRPICCSTALESSIVNANDSVRPKSALEREADLAYICRSAGVELVFEGKS